MNVARWRALYGAHPLHLVAMLAALGVAGAAAAQAAGASTAGRMLLWFLAAILISDLVLQPLVALADRGLRRVGSPRVPVINHLRIPLLGSAVLLLIFFPVILRRGERTYVAASGLTFDPYLERWLLVSATLFVLSALVYAARVLRR